MTTPTPELLEEIIATGIRAGIENEPRTQQSLQGIIGASDLGFCRQKAVLTLRQTPYTDSSPIWAAGVGTAIHRYVEELLRPQFPGWIIEGEKVIATFPSGAQVPGTPDIIVPEWNLVIDLKTANGFAWVKRDGASQNYRYQRHTYALGAIQKGVLDDKRDVWVANVYLDRSGTNPRPYVSMERFDPTLTDEVDAWIQDVIYARTHEEDASRDIPAPVCERICEFFGACRGGLPMDDADVVTDPDLIEAARVYRENGQIIKRLIEERDAARERLTGVNGVADGLQVRWTHIAGSLVPAAEKSSYDRLDVRPVRSR